MLLLISTDPALWSRKTCMKMHFRLWPCELNIRGHLRNPICFSMSAAGRQSLPTPVFIRNLSIHGGDCVDVLLSCIQPTKKQVILCRRRRKTEKCISIVPPEAEKCISIDIYSQKIITQMPFLNVVLHPQIQEFTKFRLKNDGPKSGYIIFEIWMYIPRENRKI